MIKLRLIVFIFFALVATYLLLQNGSNLNDDKTSINYSINRGLQFLYNSHKDDGSFLLNGSLDETLQNTWLDQQIFLTPLFLNILKYVKKDNKVNSMITKSLNLLMRLEEDEGGWRYYIDSNNPLRNLIPPDADDTACALYALIQYKNNYSKKSINRLLKYRTMEGLFQTWLVEDLPLEQTVCIVVNANVLILLCTLDGYEQYALQLASNFQAMFGDDVQYDDIISRTRFYTTPYAFTYSLSKTYSIKPTLFNDDFIEKLKEFILRSKTSHLAWRTPLEIALAIISLMNFRYCGDEIKDSINLLLMLQNEDGSWPQHPFITSYIPVYHQELRKIVGESAYFYSGSQELSTIICLESIMKYKSMMKR